MIELTHLIAIVISLGAAISVASSDLFIRIGTQDERPIDAVFVVMAVNLVVLVPLVTIYYYPDYGLTRVSTVSFIAAGVLGTLLGRVCLYSSISRIGASRTSPIVSANAVVATILGVIILNESLTAIHGIGIGLIVTCIAIIGWETSHENPDNLSRRALAISLLIPFGAALAYGWEPIFASYGFDEGTPAPVGLVFKTVSAAIGFVLYLRWKNALPRSTLLRSSGLRWLILAGIGNTLFLLGYYVALAIAPVNVVVPLRITSTLFVIVLAALFMPTHLERVTWKLFAAGCGVVIGILLITVYG